MIGIDHLGRADEPRGSLEAIRVGRVEAQALRRSASVDLRTVTGNTVVVALRQCTEPGGEVRGIREAVGELGERRVAFGDLGADLLGRRAETAVVVHGGGDHVHAPGRRVEELKGAASARRQGGPARSAFE